MEIEWNENGQTGYKTYAPNSKVLVYRPKYAFEQHLKWLLNVAIQNPGNFQKGVIDGSDRNSPLFFAQSDDVKHYISFRNGNTIKTQVVEQYKEYLNTHLKTNTNFDFLSRLSAKRNWCHECPVCLNDDHMGQTCDCGHQEIVIFKPCGHTMCIKPCFMEFSGLPSRTKRVMIGGNEHYLFCKPNVNLSVCFECPVCRTTVTETFASSDVFCEGVDEFVNILFWKFTEELDLWHLFRNYE